MNNLLALLISLTLVGPVAAGGMLSKGDQAEHSRGDKAPPAVSFGATSPGSVLSQSILPQDQFQVRIEQRVTIRIAPSPPSAREQMLASLPRRRMEGRFLEVEQGRCVPIGAISGVAPVQRDRLLLFMRDKQVLSAALDRTCDAQAFYAGFYVERSDDGMLCTGRDMLQSRAGASCEVSQLNRLVAVRD